MSADQTLSHAVDLETRLRITDFLALEADLADSHQYDRWLGLWDSVVEYWVPCSDPTADPTAKVAIILDDRNRLEERIARLQSGSAHAQLPRSELARVVSNPRIGRVEEMASGQPLAYQVDAKFVLVEYRSSVSNVYGGSVRFELLESRNTLTIRKKHVVLVNREAPQGNLTFLL